MGHFLAMYLPVLALQLSPVLLPLIAYLAGGVKDLVLGVRS